jgi:hypothetical protein
VKNEDMSPIREDLDSLKRTSDADIPTQNDTARAVHARMAREDREGSIMKAFRSLRGHPWLATAMAIGAVAVVLLAVPISYERTIGYEAKLTLAPTGADAQQIAGEFAKVLKTKDYNVNDSGKGIEISARVPLRSQKVVQGLAMAYAQSLGMRGVEAKWRVVPVTQRISGNVYAAGANELVEIRINRDGKTTAEIENEIREQLAAAGLPGAEVHVTEEGGQTRMEMMWQAAPGQELDCCGKDISVTFDGESTAGKEIHKIKIDHPMSDADMKTEMERQMREQGLNMEVEIKDGKVISTRPR